MVAQSQAIAALESLPELSFSVVKALNNFLTDSKVLCSVKTYLVMSETKWNSIHFNFSCCVKAFWRVRIEAAFALASTSSEVSFPAFYAVH